MDTQTQIEVMKTEFKNLRESNIKEHYDIGDRIEKVEKDTKKDRDKLETEMSAEIKTNRDMIKKNTEAISGIVTKQTIIVSLVAAAAVIIASLIKGG